MLNFRLNGQDVSVDAPAEASLLSVLRVRLETHGWVFLRSKLPPIATRIMTSETSRRAS